MTDLAEYAVRAALFLIAFVVLVWLSIRQWRKGDRSIYGAQVFCFLVCIPALLYWCWKLWGAVP
jgi:hypothetical protein